MCADRLHAVEDVAGLYTRRARLYDAFVSLLGYPSGLRAYFRRAPFLHPGLRVLDAGCGSGFTTLAVRAALRARGGAEATFHAFDLTPEMLQRFRARLARHHIDTVSLQEADVLRLDQLPADWRDYGLIVSTAMLEYLPKDELPNALAGLRERLSPDGVLVVGISKRNWITRPLFGRWWHAQLYTRPELEAAFRAAGYERVKFRQWPAVCLHFRLWGHIVEAQRSTL